MGEFNPSPSSTSAWNIDETSEILTWPKGLLARLSASTPSFKTVLASFLLLSKNRWQSITNILLSYTESSEHRLNQMEIE